MAGFSDIERHPDPSVVIHLRKQAGMSQEMAGRTVRKTGQAWGRWERGVSPMPEGLFELFCLKQGLDFERWVTATGTDGGKED